MIGHYIKIAFRNFWKYRIQTVISILGLSIGFACFSLSVFWMRYENSFDNFHAKADRIYRLYGIDKKVLGDKDFTFRVDLADYLKSAFPEIEDIALVLDYSKRVDNGSGFDYLNSLEVNNSFCDVFDLPEWVKNHDNQDFYVMTENAAKKYSNEENASGKELKTEDGLLKIKNVIKGWPRNTDLNFDLIVAKDTVSDVFYHKYYILLHKDVDVKAFEDKLSKYDNGDLFSVRTTKLCIIPLKSFRQSQLNNSGIIKYSQIEVFAFAGLLVVVCAIFNYLILLLSRIRMRGRELALRKVNGASDNSFILLFGCEIILILFTSLLLGLLLIEIILPSFKELSEIKLDNMDIYVNTLVYSFALIVAILLPVFIMIEYFKRKTLQEEITRQSTTIKASWFYKISVLIQLLISSGLILSTVIFIKQTDYLDKADIGFKRKNICKVYIHNVEIQQSQFEKIKALPAVNDAIITSGDFWGSFSQWEVENWEGKEEDKPVMLRFMNVPPDFFDFYNMTFLYGEKPPQGDNITPDIYLATCYPTEDIIKFFGWKDPIGKDIDGMKVVGVVKNVTVDPKEKSFPVIFQASSVERLFGKSLLFEFKEGRKKEAEEAISAIMEKEYPGEKFHFTYKEDIYKQFFKSERALLLILKIATGICIIISLFGIYSMVSLICIRRRKEIAIRKVNGATAFSILSQLIKEQLILLLVAILIAFPVATFIMKRWIENYVKQTEINWQIYVLITIVMIIVCIFTVFTQVWSAANRNPAEVLKSE